MRPMSSVSSSSSPSTEIKLWKSPIPYLFGGLALMMALISVALVILVCSNRKRGSQSSSSVAAAEDMKQTMPKNVEINSEPELLVIMAGDDKPTYLAKPIITSSNYCTCTCEVEESTTYLNEPRTYLVTMEPNPSSSSTSEERINQLSSVGTTQFCYGDI